MPEPGSPGKQIPCNFAEIRATPKSMPSLERISKQIERCDRCPRLRGHCRQIAEVRKREFREWEYWGRPVPGFGDPNARIWIVGLAPAAHGANRTGRMFTGDSSGNWLYRALHETGFANQATSERRDDGLELKDVYISAAARCAPPDNKPMPNEIANCESFLVDEAKCLDRVEIVVPLGKIAWDTVYRTFKASAGTPAIQAGTPAIKRADFGHGKETMLGSWKVVMSYHPSRQNTNTGRLTWAMWRGIFEKVRSLL